jgi:hypothetical protein
MIMPPDTLPADERLPESHHKRQDPISVGMIMLIIAITVLLSFLPMFWPGIGEMFSSLVHQ